MVSILYIRGGKLLASTIRVCLTKKKKKKKEEIIENTTKFFDKLEKEMCDLVCCSITFSVFPWYQILWVMSKKIKRNAPSQNFFFQLLIKVVLSSIISNFLWNADTENRGKRKLRGKRGEEDGVYQSYTEINTITSPHMLSASLFLFHIQQMHNHARHP